MSFFKKNPSSILKSQKPFYMIKDPHLNTILLNFFKHLKEQPYYHEYKKDELTQKYQTYKPLIDKILSLNPR